MVGLNGIALSEADFNPTELNGSPATLAAKDPPPRRVRSTHAARGPKPLLPRSLKETLQLAELLSKSKLIPKGFETPETCLVGILYGMEVGLSPIAALQRMAVIDGRPTIWGDAALALVQASGLLQSIREEVIDGSGERRQLASAEADLIAHSENRSAIASVSSSTSPFTEAPSPNDLTAVCTVRREGRSEPIIGTFSIEDAKRAGLWQKPGPWTDYPKRMLTMRARAFALRDAFPDVLAGLYIREEFEGAEKQYEKRSSSGEGGFPSPQDKAQHDAEWDQAEAAETFGRTKPNLAPHSNDLSDLPQDHTGQHAIRRAPPPPPVPSPTEEIEKPSGMMDRGSVSTNARTDHLVLTAHDPQMLSVVAEYDSEIIGASDETIDPETLLDLLDSALCCALGLPTLEEIVDDFTERLRPLSKDHQRTAQKIIDRHQRRVEDLDRPNEAATKTSEPDDSLNAELPRGLKSLLRHLGIRRMTSRMRRARRKERPSQSLASWNARHRLADQGLSSHSHSHVTDIDEIAPSDDQAEAGE